MEGWKKCHRSKLIDRDAEFEVLGWTCRSFWLMVVRDFRGSWKYHRSDKWITWTLGWPSSKDQVFHFHDDSSECTCCCFWNLWGILHRCTVWRGRMFRDITICKVWRYQDLMNPTDDSEATGSVQGSFLFHAGRRPPKHPTRRSRRDAEKSQPLFAGTQILRCWGQQRCWPREIPAWQGRSFIPRI